MTANSSAPSGAIAEIRVELGSRSYPILIGHGLIKDAAHHLARAMPGARFAIVADEAVSHLAGSLSASLEPTGLLLGDSCFVPSGEGSKSFSALERVCGHLLDRGIERRHGVIAIGGGVIGDLAGFAAAIVKRGVRLVQVPTTLLAQVDSSVGGKTGINSPHGKNLVGAFHQPSLVLADLGALDTLPPREFRAGYAEVAKYGALGNAQFFAWLEENQDSIFNREAEALAHAIGVSCEMKAAIVARDEFETGDRALLNLGHTFGHAVEAWAGYSGALLHGEAVALGMVLAAEFSARRGLCEVDTVQRLRSHLMACGFATDFPALRHQVGRTPGVAELLRFMEQDKKVQSGEIMLILLRGIGDAFVARGIGRQEIASFLAERLQA